MVLVLKADGISSVIAELAPEGERPAAGKRQPDAGPTSGPAPVVNAEEGRVTIRVPMKFKRRSGRKEIILPNGEGRQTSAVQESLVAAVARAHRWLTLLEDGVYNSVGELADAVGMDPSLLRRHLNLTLVRPELLCQILDGTEPEEVSLRDLLKGVPMRWEEQLAGLPSDALLSEQPG